jgi:phenylalanyl-tRNA synthetase beta chain
MKVSYRWLNNYFDGALPDIAAVADALTFHSFEIESAVGDILDVKITANRGHDCLSHRGVAKELSAILDIPLTAKYDPFAKKPDLSKKSAAVAVTIDSPLCARYIAGYIRNVKVGPSPEWLKQSLEAIGQRSINNVVDATNLVMFNIGQPLHAFDAGKLSLRPGRAGADGFSIRVRTARQGERMVALDSKEYEFADGQLLITDAHSDMPIGIAGVKGGAPASITEETTDIIIESANFDGVSVRRTAAALKLKTDASDRFQQVISPEIAAYGMQQAVDLILALAGGEVEGFADVYPQPLEQKPVSVTLSKINGVLGTSLAQAEVGEIFLRLGLAHQERGEEFIVTPSFERLDLVIPEDLIEEVGRIKGYEFVPEVELPHPAQDPAVNARFAAMERKREELMARGYSEVITSAFAETGDRVVANKVDGVRPYLRPSLIDGLADAYEKNSRNKDVLGLKEIKLFEIGTVWKKGTEEIVVGIADASGVREESLVAVEADSYAELPVSATLRYAPFSRYPHISRDIALWVPVQTAADEVLQIIRANAGELLTRAELFDEFKKGDRVSYAFRLVFQSFDKTLTDEDANARMESVYAAVRERGWEVR